MYVKAFETRLINDSYHSKLNYFSTDTTSHPIVSEITMPLRRALLSFYHDVQESFYVNNYQLFV